MKSLVARIAIIACSLTLLNCGGSGDGDDSPPTIRPKTMDGITLRLDNAAQFEFVRNTGSSRALESGDEETGTFFYTSFVGQANLRYYDNLNNDQSNFGWPQSVAVASYTYRAINESSGVLTLIGTGQILDEFYSLTGFILNDSRVLPFISGSFYNVFDFDLTNVVQIDLTFSSNGTSVTTDTVTFSLPESTTVATFDTVRIPSLISLTTGQPLPENYNPVIDPLRPSLIAPESLSDRLFSGTNGIPDMTKNFTIQFVADANQPVGGGGNLPDEVGHGLLRVAGSAIDIALDYTWTRIGGTDSGELVLSNIPDTALPFDSSLNGSYILNFLGTENGTYTGSADGDTLDPADVTGTFIMLNGN